jgi:hypothetical protein
MVIFSPVGRTCPHQGRAGGHHPGCEVDSSMSVNAFVLLLLLLRR